LLKSQPKNLPAVEGIPNFKSNHMENNKQQPPMNEIRAVMENISWKMSQVRQMFPNYYTSLHDTYKEMQFEDLKSAS
jgi:hypothetical protein